MSRKPRPKRPEPAMVKPKGNKTCPICKGPMDTEWAIAKGRGVQWVCTSCYKPYARRK